MTLVTAEVAETSYTGTIKREGTQMTIRIYQTQQIVHQFIKAVSRRHHSLPTGMDRHFLADIGLSQNDVIASYVR